MYIRHRYLILASALVALLAGSVTLSQQAGEAPPLRYVENEAYGFGELLKYKIGYKFITAGTAAFKIAPEPLIYEDRNCYDIRFEVRSLKSLDWLYRVRDQYRTVLDIDGIFPWRFEQHIREGNYKRDFKAELDQRNGKAITDKGEYELKPFTHDIVSAFYFLRTQDLQGGNKGDTLHLNNFYKDSVYALPVYIHGRQTVEVEAGKFRCIVIEPMVVEGGLFKSDGRIIIWLSDDERKIPVKVSTHVVIGAIDAELTGYEGLRGPLAAKLPDDD